MTMKTMIDWAACKSMYVSPMAEEIVVSFEDGLLQGTLRFSRTTQGGAGADPEYHEIEGGF